jgi:hypothetical protein
MGGCTKTSTHDVTASAPRSPCSKSKTRGTASAATPTLSGHLHLTGSVLVIVMRCCSTCLAKGTFQTKEQARTYCVIAKGGLILVETLVIYVQFFNHIMVIVIALHQQIHLVIVSQLMVLVQTCSLTTRVKTSQ